MDTLIEAKLQKWTEQFNTGEEFPSVDTAGMNIGQHAQHLKTIGKQPTSAAEILKDDNTIKHANALCSQPNLALRGNNMDLT